MTHGSPIQATGVSVRTDIPALLFLLSLTATFICSPAAKSDEPTEVAQDSADEAAISVESTQEPDGSRRLVAKGMIAAPPQRVWAVIDDCADYKKNFISVTESKEISRAGNVRRCSTTVSMPFPFPDLLAISDSTVEIEQGKVWKRSWRLVEGDFKIDNGCWTLVPYGKDGQQTMLTYEVQAELKIPIPQFIVASLQKHKIPALFEKIRSDMQDDNVNTPSQ